MGREKWWWRWRSSRRRSRRSRRIGRSWSSRCRIGCFARARGRFRGRCGWGEVRVSIFFHSLYSPTLFLFPLPSMTWHWGETLGFDIPREIGVVLDITKSELLLQRMLLDGRAVEQDAVDVVDHEGDVGAAVLRHALLDGGEVLPLFPSLSEEFDTRRSCTAWDSRNR